MVYLIVKLTSAPDGNGGIYRALRQCGILESMKNRGIVHIHSYCVDNCLVRVADPVFIGYCAERNADCAAKVVPKATPEEPVGVICLKGGKPSVVEYSEISKEMSEQRHHSTTHLVYGAANIANHYYTLSFLEKTCDFENQMQYHVAKKKIACIDLQTGEKIKPSTPNGIKLELFVFDVFPFAKQFAVLEVERCDEFSPLKNPPGSKTDGPETSRRDILGQHTRWLKHVGAKGPTTEVEISPLMSYAGEGLNFLKGRSLME